MEKVYNKRRIKGVIQYLIKWAGWPLEYNSYKPASYLTNAPKAVSDFKRKLKHKRKEAVNNTSDESASPIARQKRFRRG